MLMSDAQQFPHLDPSQCLPVKNEKKEDLLGEYGKEEGLGIDVTQVCMLPLQWIL